MAKRLIKRTTEVFATDEDSDDLLGLDDADIEDDLDDAPEDERSSERTKKRTPQRQR